jgi:hypothetical protein
MKIPDNLDVLTYFDLIPKIRKFDCLAEQFFKRIELERKMGLSGNFPFTIQNKNAEIFLSLTPWSSKMAESFQLVRIKNVEVKKRYQGQGIFSAFCEKVLANPEVDGIYYDTVVNERFASILQRRGYHRIKVNQFHHDNLFSELIKSNPSFLQLKEGVEVKDINSLDFSYPLSPSRFFPLIT